MRTATRKNSSRSRCREAFGKTEFDRLFGLCRHQHEDMLLAKMPYGAIVDSACLSNAPVNNSEINWFGFVRTCLSKSSEPQEKLSAGE